MLLTISSSRTTMTQSVFAAGKAGNGSDRTKDMNRARAFAIG